MLADIAKLTTTLGDAVSVADGSLWRPGRLSPSQSFGFILAMRGGGLTEADFHLVERRVSCSDERAFTHTSAPPV